MKTRNKLLTLLILAAGDAAPPLPVSTRPLNCLRFPDTFLKMKAAPLYAITGALETFTIQKKAVVNRFF